MLLCLAGIGFLASSDVFVNMSAAVVIGSNEDSRVSFELVAIGCVLALLAAGGVTSAVDSMLAKLGITAAVCLMSAFSAVLTIQSTSIDYAVNDQNGFIEEKQREANKQSAKALAAASKSISGHLDECNKDRYYGSEKCQRSLDKITALADQQIELNQRTAESYKRQEIDITEAVYQKTGIPGQWIETASIFTRAFGVPLMIYILSFGFWHFWSELFGDVKSKKKLVTA
jgi:hypothetical protein